MTYLPAALVHRWLACQGSAALEEYESPAAEPLPEAATSDALWEPYLAHYQGQHAAITKLPLERLALGEITGERGAEAFANLLLAEFSDHSELAITPSDEVEPSMLLALAGVVKYSLLHNFTQTNVGTPESLYEFGQKVTEAAAIALSVRGDIAALSHLTPGPYCVGCRAAYRCPALGKLTHEEVFGPLQAPDEPNLKPIALAARLDDGEIAAILAAALAKIPLIEAWIASVRAQAGVSLSRAKRATSTPKKQRRKRKRRARADPGVSN